MADIKSHSTLPTSLNAYWGLDTLNDEINDNTLTDNGPDFTVGRVGKGSDFELANTDYYSAADSASLSITGDMSINFWYKFESSSTDQLFVAKATGGNNQNSFFFKYNTSGSTLEFSCDADGVNLGTATTTVSWTPTDGQWYMLTLVYDASAGTSDFYVNGSQQGTQQSGLDTSMFDGTANLLLGVHWDLAAWWADGTMDELGIWSKELTTDEITDLYNDGYGIGYYTPVDIANDDDLSTSLVSHWKMDEASGTRVDSVTASGNDLTDNNTVTSESGKRGLSGQFTDANAEYLSIADGSQTGLDLSTDFSFNLWVYVDANPGSGNRLGWISKGAGTPNKSYFFDLLNLSGTLKLDLTLSNDGTADTSNRSDWTPTVDTWYMVTVTYDLSAGSANFYIDGALHETVGSGKTSLNNSSSAFTIGENNLNAGDYMDGRLDEVGLWSKELTGLEVKALYNFGAPLPYEAPTTVSDDTLISTDLDHYWTMDEASGNREDSVGSVTLTETGTVAAIAGKIDNAVEIDHDTTDGFTFDDTGFPTAGPRSFACWLNTTNSADNIMFVFGYGTNSTNQHWGPMLGNSDSSTRNMPCVSNYGSSVYGDTAVPLDEWVHVAWVNIATNVHIFYINGIAIGNSNTPTFSTVLNAGSLGTDLGAANDFDGGIDESGFWDKILTQGEVWDLYKAGVGLPYAVAGPSFVPTMQMF